MGRDGQSIANRRNGINKAKDKWSGHIQQTKTKQAEKPSENLCGVGGKGETHTWKL